MRRVTKGNSYGVRLSPKDEQMVLNYINEEQMTFAEFARECIRKQLAILRPTREVRANG